MLTTVFICGCLVKLLQVVEPDKTDLSVVSGNVFFFVGLVFLAPLGVGFFASFKQEKRDKLFKAWALQNGWEYSGADNDDILWFDDKDNYRLFKLGTFSKELYSMAQRPFENGKIYLFDYYYEKGKYPYSTDIKTTCLRIWSPAFALPYFALYPEGFFSSIGEMFGYNDIDFPTHPNFSARYKLSGKDEAGIRDLFPPKVIDCFDRMPDVCIDGGGQSIYIYRLDHLEPIETLNRFVSEKINVLNVLRQPR